MTREEAIGYHKKVHELSKSHLTLLKKQEPATKQIWLNNLIYALGDLAYKEIGIDAHELDC